jgi:hypothetical protein
MNIALSDYNELRCLHLTICEAKFHPDPDRKEVQGSPFVADTANKVYDKLISEAPTAREASRWVDHRHLQTNYMIYPSILRICRNFFAKNNLTDTQKTKFIYDCAAPYTISDELLRCIEAEL